MANIKISELNELETKHRNDLLPIVNSSNNETEKIKVENLINENVELIAVSPTAPSECSLGDKYFNTTSNKLYTAIATNTWSSTGENAVEGILYIVFNEQSTYAYNGTTLVSVGGGSGSSDIVIIGDESETTEDTKLLVDTSGTTDTLKYKDNNTFTELQIKALDSMPVGTIVEFNGQASDIPSGWEETTDPNSYSTSEVKTNKTWIDGKPIYRKVLELTNVPRGYKEHLHNINNLGDIINVYGRFKETTIQNPVNRVVADNITTYGIGIVDINATKIHTLLGNGVPTTNTMKVVLEYTKTTD